MGYRVDAKAVLVLDGYEGAEVTVTIGVPLAALREWDLATDLAAEWEVFVRAACPEWNLEDAQGPVPVALESLERLPQPISRAIMRGWRTAAAEPPAPLPRPSSGGEP